MPLTIKPASGSGSVTLQSVAGTSTNDTLTLPAKTGNIITSADSGTVTQTMLASGVAGKGPAFYTSLTSNTSISNNTSTVAPFNSVAYDTASCFNTTTYTFTPNVAGYYLITAGAAFGTTNQYGALDIQRNTVSVASVNFWTSSFGLSGSITSIQLMNGTTDALRIVVFQNTGSSQNMLATISSYFAGTLIRAA